MSKHQEVFEKKDVVHVKSNLSYEQMKEKKPGSNIDFFIENEKVEIVISKLGFEICEPDFIAFKAYLKEEEEKEAKDYFLVGIPYDPQGKEVEAVFNNYQNIPL